MSVKTMVDIVEGDMTSWLSNLVSWRALMDEFWTSLALACDSFLSLGGWADR